MTRKKWLAILLDGAGYTTVCGLAWAYTSPRVSLAIVCGLAAHRVGIAMWNEEGRRELLETYAPEHRP